MLKILSFVFIGIGLCMIGYTIVSKKQAHEKLNAKDKRSICTGAGCLLLLTSSYVIPKNNEVLSALLLIIAVIVAFIVPLIFFRK